MKKKCPTCNGDGFKMIEETPEDCERCAGTGEVIIYDLFEIIECITPLNKVIINAYTNS
jgi:DnaJ-class molecular chaperone